MYFTQTPLEDSARSFQAHLIDLLPAGWLRDRFLIRLGTRLDDAAMRAEGERALRARVERLLWWNRLWAVAQLCLVAAGGMALWWGLRRRDWVVATSPLPPPWRASAAATILIRGLAVGILLAGLVVVAGMALGIGEAFVTFILDPLLFLPALLMVRAHLLRPSGIGMREGFGLSVPPGRWRQVAIAVLGAVAISFLGDWVLGSIQGALGWSSHWTEWFDPELAWGSPVAVSCSLVGSVIVGPVFEELTFRGIVFGACRRRFRWGLAALLSAALFGFVHGYDVIGFLSTFWSGLIWASLYEATGSLLPGMIAHGLNNLLVSVNLILMRLA